MTQNSLIEEIVTKECERYDLEGCRFITDRRTVIRELCGQVSGIPDAACSSEEYAVWKQQLLERLYSRQGFANFLTGNRNYGKVYTMTRRLMKNFILRLRRAYKADTIDDELQVASCRTVAFKLSSPLFTAFYPQVLNAHSFYASPGQLENRCEVLMQQTYPLDYSRFREQLQSKDNEFWEELWTLVRQFVSCLMVSRSSSADREELIGEVSVESILSFQEQMEQHKLDAIATATHLLHSLRRTCRNKLHEFFYRQNKQQEELLDEAGWEQLTQTMDEMGSGSLLSSGDDDIVALLDVNEDDDYELSCLIVELLIRGEGVLYQQLIGTETEKVAVLMMHYIKQMSYEEIARQLYGTATSQSCSQLRQSTKRMKDYLKRRIRELVIQAQKGFFIPTAERSYYGQKM